MATDDESLMTEVRFQTGLTDKAVLGETELINLIGRAKSEIESEIGAVQDWYGSINIESALFWLVCIFSVGEGTNDDGFSIGELDFRPGEASATPQAWRTRYEKHMAALGSSESSPFSVAKIERTDRTYEYE